MIFKPIVALLLAPALGYPQAPAAQRFLYGIGSTLQLTAACDTHEWSTSDESVATVDAAGLVTAAGYGAAFIHTSCGGAETAFPLRVAPPLPAETSATDIVAFRNVTVIPMDSPGVLEAQTVVVRNGRIAEIGPAGEVSVPDDAYSIWAEGMYLFPGLVDMHIHEVASPDWEKDLFLYLANGVTTVREMWGTPEYLRRRAAIASGSVPGPRMFVASPALDGPSGRFTAMTPPVATAEEARRTVALDRAAGYDYIKIYTVLPPEAYTAALAEAAALGIRAVGHVPSGVGIRGAIAAGQYTVEHFMGMEAVATPPNLTAGLLDDAQLRVLAAELRDAGTWSTATFAVSAVTQDRLPSLRERPEMRYISPAFRRWFEDPTNAAASASTARLIANKGVILRALHEAGAKLILGTDSGFRYVLPGFSIHDELRMTVEAGLEPYDALRLATAAAAACLERLEQFGTVERGKAADLLLLEGNPLEDVSNAARRAGVMAAGRWYSEERLKERLDGIARSYGR